MKIFLLVCCIVMLGFGFSYGAFVESITIYEQTGIIFELPFMINDPRLVTTVQVNKGFFDFTSQGFVDPGGEKPGKSEWYDTYISNADGRLNTNGLYLTINCYRGGTNSVGDGVGNNIDAVSLDYTDRTHTWANEITNYILGNNQPLEWAYLHRALGLPDGYSTRVGDEFSSITLGFGLTESIAPVPIPATVLLLGSGLVGLWGFRKKFKK